MGFIDYLLNNSAESSHTCVFRFSTRNLGLDIEKICQTAEVLSLADKSSPDSAHKSDSQLTDCRILLSQVDTAGKSATEVMHL